MTTQYTGLLQYLCSAVVLSERVHLSPDVRQRQPQGEDDGQDDKVGEPFPEGVGPGKAQGLVFIILFLDLRTRESEVYTLPALTIF